MAKNRQVYEEQGVKITRRRQRYHLLFGKSKLKKFGAGEHITVMREKIAIQENTNKSRELLYGLVCVMARDNPNLYARLDKTSLLTIRQKEISQGTSLADYLNYL